MAHFARLDENNIVTRVNTVPNDVMIDPDSLEESEQLGVDYLTERVGEGNWKQTSYNTAGGEHRLGGTPFRKNYCGKGYVYHPAPIDGFSPPQPYPSWILDEETGHWKPPVPHPPTPEFIPGEPPKQLWKWNEDEQQWDAVTDVFGGGDE